MKLLRLKGGLGNQIFQVIHLIQSSSSKESLYIDISLFGRRFAHDYAGSKVLVDQVLSKETLERIKFININHKISGIFWKILGRFKSVFLDDYFSDTRLFPLQNDYNKYFNLKCSTVDSSIDENSVLIHVRKGDYTNSENAKIYFNCEPDYFAKAIEEVSRKLKSPTFFIMSNDNDWVRENFTFLKNYTILDIEDPILSFKIMNKFSHFIISNSTFSWWPAFMTKSDNVVAPKKWYLDEQKNINLYPDHWKKV